ncbi:hypothetical protein [Pseudomonas sp. LS-2]|uniref:hypothetical protein n=1 Tax=Pseudomonas sp. LS-2 TaxID=2315859 RepID=UPI000E72526D|nr:hypothetical protein [Pseudomonas sp. LS-2]RJX72649.1 hypothetical protein D3M70_31095 [Pseudomonas sp. LS-2]
MNTNSFLAPKSSFRWLLSYQGSHTYECTFGGKDFRIEVQVARERYPQHSTLTKQEFEKSVNSSVGFIKGDPLKITPEFVASFNRHRYSDWMEQVSKMRADPDRYGDYMPSGFNIYVGAVYGPEGWTPTQRFEEVRALAGVPLEVALDAALRTH